MKVGQHALQYHQRVGHQDTHRKADGQQGGRVQGVPQELQKEKGHHDGEGHGNGHHEGGAHVIEEEKKDGGGEEHSLPDVAHRAVHRRLDVASVVVDPGELQTSGKIAVQPFHGLLDVVHHFHRVGVRFFHHPDTDARNPVQEDRLPPLLRAHLYGTQIPDEPPGSVFSRHLEAAELFHLLIFGVESHGVLRAPLLQTPRRKGVDPLLQGLHHGKRGEPRSSQGVPLEQHVHLPLGSPEQFHVGHPGDDGKLISQGVVRVVVHLVQRQIPREGQGHNGTGVHVELLNDGFFHTVGKFVHLQIDLLPHVRGHHVHVHPELKLQHALNHVLQADRGDVLEAVHRRHGVLDLLRHVRFQILGRGAGPDRHHRDVGGVHLGHEFQPHLAVGVAPQKGQGDEQTRHGHRTPERRTGKRHGHCPFVWSEERTVPD